MLYLLIIDAYISQIFLTHAEFGYITWKSSQIKHNWNFLESCTLQIVSLYFKNTLRFDLTIASGIEVELEI